MLKSFINKGFIALILFLAPVFCCHAQESVRMYVFAYPTSAYIELDGQRIIQTDTGVMATVGTHQLKVWLPDYKVVDSLITIQKEDNNIFRIYLKLSPQYITHQKDMQKFKLNNAVRLGIPILCAGACAAMTLLMNKAANDYHDKAVQNELDYAGSVSQESMDKHKKDFEKNRANYKLCKAGSYGFAGLTALSIFFTVRVAIQNSHREPPAKSY